MGGTYNKEMRPEKEGKKTTDTALTMPLNEGVRENCTCSPQILSLLRGIVEKNRDLARDAYRLAQEYNWVALSSGLPVLTLKEVTRQLSNLELPREDQTADVEKPSEWSSFRVNVVREMHMRGHSPEEILKQVNGLRFSCLPQVDLEGVQAVIRDCPEDGEEFSWTLPARNTLTRLRRENPGATVDQLVQFFNREIGTYVGRVSKQDILEFYFIPDPKSKKDQ